MRNAITIALLAGLLAWPGAGQEARRGPEAGNVLTRYLDEADIHPPARVGRLTVFPVTLGAEARLTGVLTMDQALAKRLLVIEELPEAQVSKARFVNKSGDQMIFLMAGEVITGGKQNRTLTTDALLGPDSTTVLELYCVQRGRWQGGKDFARDTTVAPQAVRERAAQQAGQGEVWSEVARANRRLGAANETGDLNEAMTKPQNVQRLTKLRKRIVPKLPPGTAGVVVAVEGRIVGADLFNSPELFSAMREKVLNSYLSQYALDETVSVRGEDRGGEVSQYDVRAYLQACYQARFAPGEQRGVGRIYHVRGTRHGETLVYGRAVPVRPRKEKGSKIIPVPTTSYMVHTALMQRVVPVKDEPPPRPPRPMPQPDPEDR